MGAAVFFFLPILVLAQANNSFCKPDRDIFFWLLVYQCTRP